MLIFMTLLTTIWKPAKCREKNQRFLQKAVVDELCELNIIKCRI